MATTQAVTTPAYPKRKRKEISYKESSSDESEVDDEYDESDGVFGTRGKKKLKASHTTVSNKPLPKRKIFPFMSLPAELKNEIYALALIDPNCIFLVSKTKRHRRIVQRSDPSAVRPGCGCRFHSQSSASTSTVNKFAALIPNILLLNRAVYAETQPILYAGNTFALDDTSALHAFLANIGPKNRATVTDITLRGWGYTRGHKAFNHSAFTMLASAMNLSSLRLDCRLNWGGPQRVAKQLYRDGFHWLEAVGVAKGKFDAAIDVLEISDENWRRYYGRVADAPSPEHQREAFNAQLRRMLR